MTDNWALTLTFSTLSIGLVCGSGCAQRRIAYERQPVSVVSGESVAADPTSRPSAESLRAAPATETVVTEAPPPPPVEVVGAAPDSSQVWMPGVWEWHDRWVWVPGQWVIRPHPKAVWVQGRWVQRRQGWIWIRGYWR